MNRQRAESITMEFIGLIDDVAEAVRIAGSIRREKPEVKDAEIVLMPTAALYQRLDRMVVDGVIAKARYGDRNLTRWGDNYRGLMYRDLRIEIFTADPINYGWIYFLRTGPGDANQYIVTQMQRTPVRAQGGYLWHADRWQRVKDGWDSPDKRKLAVRTESMLFDVLGIVPIAPKDRTLERYQRMTLFGRGSLYDFAPIDDQPIKQPGLL